MPPHYAQATFAGVLNASARSDDEARQLIVWKFGPLLVLVVAVDVAGALALLWIPCSSAEHTAAAGQCLVSALTKGLSFRPLHPEDGLGDLFWLAAIRCVTTTVLLWLGVHYGRYRQQQQAEESTGTVIDQEIADVNHLTEPLLATSSSSPADPLSRTNRVDDNSNNDAMERQAPPTSSSSRNCCIRCHPEPSTARVGVLVALFVSSAVYQVYAGLKVSAYPESSTVIAVLMCLTILWVNSAAYLFRILLAELTRPAGKFLPPEVHRHPVFFDDSRGLALHWCDLCRQRISQGGCYRCSLCDFDVCVACASRSDAATAGENLLRSDRGVRVETSMDNGSYFRRSLAVARSELPLLAFSFGLLAASSVTTLLLPHFQGKIIDKVIPSAEDGTYDRAGFSHYIKLYVFFMLGQGALSTLYSAIFTLVSRRLKFSVRNSLLDRILSQDVAYFDGTESGRLISCLTNDVELMMQPIQTSLSSLLSNVLILLGGMFMCFYKSYRLSMLAFVTVGPISFLWEQYAQWSKGLAREMLAYWADGNSIASQALLHVRTVKAFGCEDKVIEKFSATNKQALNCGIKDAWGNGVTSALTGYLDLGSGVLILFFGGKLVYDGEMSVGELVTFQLFWNMMNNAYQSLQGLVTSFTRSAAGAEKIFSLWDSDPDIDPSKGSDITWNVTGAIEMKNVQFFYQMRPDNIVLDKFNLSIPAGKTVALVGRSGGGKSTIINLLLRFYDVKEGAISLDGRDYPSLKVNQLRRLFGVVTQETELFALTVEENIAYGLNKDEYTMDDVVEASKKAFAHEFICEMKDGYQTRIGERGNRLSGGQRQRLAIARVFLRRPKLILLDEATSALDENSQEAVQTALSNLIAESHATVVLVAHRLSTVKNADRIVVIDKGVALEQGNHDELVAQGGIYASMVEKQTHKMADQLNQEKHTGGGKKDDDKPVDDIDSLLDEHLSAAPRENKQDENKRGS